MLAADNAVSSVREVLLRWEKIRKHICSILRTAGDVHLVSRNVSLKLSHFILEQIWEVWEVR